MGHRLEHRPHPQVLGAGQPTLTACRVSVATRQPGTVQALAPAWPIQTRSEWDKFETLEIKHVQVL